MGEATDGLTTADIREACYQRLPGEDGDERFDAWLAAHDREVEARALREVANRAVNIGTVSGSGVDVGRRAASWLRREADRIASP